jgi:hypothetical protein
MMAFYSFDPYRAMGGGQAVSNNWWEDPLARAAMRMRFPGLANSDPSATGLPANWNNFNAPGIPPPPNMAGAAATPATQPTPPASGALGAAGYNGQFSAQPANMAGIPSNDLKPDQAQGQMGGAVNDAGVLTGAGQSPVGSGPNWGAKSNFSSVGTGGSKISGGGGMPAAPMTTARAKLLEIANNPFAALSFNAANQAIADARKVGAAAVQDVMGAFAERGLSQGTSVASAAAATMEGSLAAGYKTAAGIRENQVQNAQSRQMSAISELAQMDQQATSNAMSRASQALNAQSQADATAQRAEAAAATVEQNRKELAAKQETDAAKLQQRQDEQTAKAFESDRNFQSNLTKLGITMDNYLAMDDNRRARVAAMIRGQDLTATAKAASTDVAQQNADTSSFNADVNAYDKAIGRQQAGAQLSLAVQKQVANETHQAIADAATEAGVTLDYAKLNQAGIIAASNVRLKLADMVQKGQQFNQALAHQTIVDEARNTVEKMKLAQSAEQFTTTNARLGKAADDRLALSQTTEARLAAAGQDTSAARQATQRLTLLKSIISSANSVLVPSTNAAGAEVGTPVPGMPGISYVGTLPIEQFVQMYTDAQNELMGGAQQ